MAAEQEQDAPAAPDAAAAAPEEATTTAPRERVRVAVRVRPLTEGATRATACAKDKLRLKTAHDEKAFKFDVVFDEAATQDHVYAHTAQKLVERVFDGRNATIMAYGQTGALAASRRVEAPSRHQTRPWVVSFSILRPVIDTSTQVRGRPTPWASPWTCYHLQVMASSREPYKMCSSGAEP